MRALARLLKPRAGSVLLDGQEIHRFPTREVARRLGLLPQTPTTPPGILVADLVARGRTPHQRLFQAWSAEDEEAVLDALEATATLELADRPVDELSGGQRQRVWIAIALAQETDLLLLGEPTTFLDLPIRSRSSTSSLGSTGVRRARSSSSSTTSTSPAATPAT